MTHYTSPCGLPVTKGTVWTTDAPYRETHAQLLGHAAAGVFAVEMQAASHFAFAAARNFSVGIVAHITNAVDYRGQPFDKGEDVSGELLLEAMCRAGMHFLRAATREKRLSDFGQQSPRQF